jgi:hypothetical protein
LGESEISLRKKAVVSLRILLTRSGSADTLFQSYLASDACRGRGPRARKPDVVGSSPNSVPSRERAKARSGMGADKTQQGTVSKPLHRDVDGTVNLSI